MTNREIKGQVIAVQDTAQFLTILLDTTDKGNRSQIEIKTTRHEDLQDIKRGSKITISVTHDNK